jgi:hypothetical protein
VIRQEVPQLNLTGLSLAQNLEFINQVILDLSSLGIKTNTVFTDTWCFSNDIKKYNLAQVNPNRSTGVTASASITPYLEYTKYGIGYATYRAGIVKIQVPGLTAGNYCFSMNVLDPTSELLRIAYANTSGSVVEDIGIAEKRVFSTFTSSAANPVTYIQLTLTKDTILGGFKVEEGIVATPNRPLAETNLNSLEDIQIINTTYSNNAYFGISSCIIRGEILPAYLEVEHTGVKANYTTPTEVLEIKDPKVIDTVKYGVASLLDVVNYKQQASFFNQRYEQMKSELQLRQIDGQNNMRFGVKHGI